MNKVKCKLCGIEKEETEFYTNNETKRWRSRRIRYECKECSREFYRKRYHDKVNGLSRPREYFSKKKIRNHHTTKHIYNKSKLVELFGGKCIRCGYSKCISALDFHHLHGNTKDFGLSKYKICYKNIAKLADEISKCILLCSNCHREEHHLHKEKTALDIISNEYKLRMESLVTLLEEALAVGSNKANNH